MQRKHPHHIHHQQPQHRPLESGAQTRVDITLLGGFRVTIDGTATPTRGWSRRSAAALVKILALAPGHRLHREKVMDILWPDEGPERSAPRLHKAAYFARRAAGHEDAVVLRDDLVWLFPDAEVTVDAVRFEQLARTALSERDPNAARQALDWYGGELLPGDRYDDWAIERREQLHLRQLDVLRLIGEWRELSELDPTDEEAHVQLMQRHLDAGDARAALQQYRHLERVLDREMGVEPGDEARRLRAEAGRLDLIDERECRRSVEVLLAELAELESRQHELLAELASVGAYPPLDDPGD